MAKRIKPFLAAFMAFLMLFSACAYTDNGNSSITPSTEQTVTDRNESDKGNTQEEDTTEKLPETAQTISLSDIPSYSGKPYIEINNNIPFFTTNELITVPFERYSPLDSKGRCGVAYANICQEIMPTEERGAIGMIKPSGWQTVKYDFVDGKYLYNRCHLIGYQLAGENANEKNLITGTRYLNVVTMLQFENRVAYYVTATNNHVLYRVTPLFDGNNLLASGVLMEGYSVEDKGKGICYNVFCYNIQPGVVINYANGESCVESVKSEEPIEEEKTAPAPVAEDTREEVRYIGNRNTKKFHYPYCSSVDDMKEKNKVPLYCSRDEAIAKGYSPCGRCHP